MKAVEDQQIIALFQQRSENAIVELSAKYGPLCKKLAYNILGDRHDAEECVNDAYLTLWNKIPPEAPEPLSAYLCAVVRNIAINRYYYNTAAQRSSSYTVALQEIEGCLPSPASVESDYLAKETTRSIEQFLKKQDQKARVLFMRRYWYGDSIEELSALFGISKHQVSVRLHRIRTKLKKHLIKEGIYP